jgi:hypothetical protein
MVAVVRWKVTRIVHYAFCCNEVVQYAYLSRCYVVNIGEYCNVRRIMRTHHKDICKDTITCEVVKFLKSLLNTFIWVM